MYRKRDQYLHVRLLWHRLYTYTKLGRSCDAGDDIRVVRRVGVQSSGTRPMGESNRRLRDGNDTELEEFWVEARPKDGSTWGGRVRRGRHTRVPLHGECGGSLGPYLERLATDWFET